MERRSLFRGLLIFGLLVNLALIVVFAAQKPDMAPISSWTEYKSADGAFSISYPHGWCIREIDRHSVEHITKFTCGPDSYLAVVSSTIATIMIGLPKAGPTQKEPLENFHEKLVESVKESSAHMYASETTEAKIAGSPAYGTTLRYRTWDCLKGRSMEATLLSTMNGEDYIALMYVCPFRDHDKMLAAFGTFTAGFKPHNRPVVQQ